MSETVIVNTGENSEASTEATETVADASVQIAEVQAERDVEIARIEAETSQAQTDAAVAMAAIETQRNDELWTRLIAVETALASHQHPELMERLAATEATLATLTALSSSTPPTEEAPAETTIVEAVEPEDGAADLPAAAEKPRRVRLL